MYRTNSTAPKKFGSHTSTFRAKPRFGSGTKKIFSNNSRPTFKSKFGGNKSNKKSIRSPRDLLLLLLPPNLLLKVGRELLLNIFFVPLPKRGFARKVEV